MQEYQGKEYTVAPNCDRTCVADARHCCGVHNEQGAQQAKCTVGKECTAGWHVCMSVWCTPRQANIGNLCQRVVPIQQDVLGLEVHMDDLHTPHSGSNHAV